MATFYLFPNIYGTIYSVINNQRYESGTPIDVMPGSTVHIVAAANSGYQFDGWSVLSPSGLELTILTDAIASFTMPYAETIIEAKMSAKQTGIAYNFYLYPGTNGTAYAQINGVNYNASLQAISVIAGTIVTIYATPNDGYQLSGWNGSPTTLTLSSYTSSPTSFTMLSQDVTLMPQFSVIATSVRPDNFVWSNTKTSGSSFNLMASEWTQLQQNINKVRVYKKLSEYGFTGVNSGSAFTALLYNQVVDAIQGISGAGTSLSKVSAGDPVSASKLNALVSAINSVK